MLAAIPWPVYLLVLGALGLPLGYMWWNAAKEDTLLRKAGLSRGRQMPLPEFVRYLEALFAGMGYQVKRPPQRDDYGADLILKDGTSRQTAVNARHFKERIGPETLSEVASGAEYHDCEETLVVSIIGFANQTIDRAEETGTILWDVSDLAEAMEKVRSRPREQGRAAWEHGPAAQSPFAPGPLAQGAAQSPFAPVAAGRQPSSPPPQPEALTGPPCPVCRKPMEAKVAAGREIWLCSRFPHCNGAMLRETQQ